MARRRVDFYIEKIINNKEINGKKIDIAINAFNAGFALAMEEIKQIKSSCIDCKTCKHKELITIECNVDDCRHERKNGSSKGK